MKLNNKNKGKQGKRKTILDNFRARGNFFHNMKVVKVRGELIVWRRPIVHDVVEVTDYRLCPYSLAFITKKEMWRHAKRCPGSTREDDG